MTLYELLKVSECDYDTWDNVYDAEVVACINTEPEDDYDEFCVALCNKIEVIEIKEEGWLICNWSDYIKRNINVFREFANKYWTKNNFDDDDDFICEWIDELGRFMAGYGADSQYWFYKMELVDKCE